MTQPRFDSDIAHDKGTATFAPMSDAGNRPPKVHFVVTDGNAMGASPPGVKIVCELDENGRSHARLNDMRPGHEDEHIADVIVTPGAGRILPTKREKMSNVCAHGSLSRTCPQCEAANEIARLRAENTLLRTTNKSQAIANCRLMEEATKLRAENEHLRQIAQDNAAVVVANTAELLRETETLRAEQDSAIAELGFEVGGDIGLVDCAKEARAALTSAREEARELATFLLGLYDATCREGWEDGPSESEMWDRVVDVLSNFGLDPGICKHAAAVRAARKKIRSRRILAEGEPRKAASLLGKYPDLPPMPHRDPDEQVECTCGQDAPKAHRPGCPRRGL